MNARIGVLALLAILGLIASWMLGYQEGQQTGAFRLVHEMDVSYDKDLKNAVNDDRLSYDRGAKNQMDQDRDAVCNEIRHYKLSIAKDLDENTQICGWRDMDGPENPNWTRAPRTP